MYLLSSRREIDVTMNFTSGYKGEMLLPFWCWNFFPYSSDINYTASSIYPAYPFILMRGYFISIHYIPHCTTIYFMMVQQAGVCSYILHPHYHLFLFLHHQQPLHWLNFYLKVEYIMVEYIHNIHNGGIHNYGIHNGVFVTFTTGRVPLNTGCLVCIKFQNWGFY